MGWWIRAPPRRRSGVRGIHSGALDGLGLSATAARAADRKIGSPELPTPACGCAAASARRRALGSRRAVGAARMSGTARWGDREPRRPSLRPGRLARLGEVASARRPHSASGLPTAPGAGSRRHRRPRGDVTLLPGIFSARSISVRAERSTPCLQHATRSPAPASCSARLLEASPPQQRCGRHAQSHAALSAVGPSSALPPPHPGSSLPRPCLVPPLPVPLTLHPCR